MIVTTAINLRYKGKIKPGSTNYWNFNMTFQTFSIDILRIATAIKMGYSITAPHVQVRRHRPTQKRPNYRTTYSVQENVTGVQFIGLDCDTKDERSTFDWWIANCALAREYGLMYTTSSHTDENPKCRILMPVERPLTVEEYRIVIRQIMSEFNTDDDVIIDKSCKDASRLWFGSEGCKIRYPQVDKGVSIDVLKARYIDPYIKNQKDIEEARRIRKEKNALRAKHVVSDGGAAIRYVDAAISRQVKLLREASEGCGDRHLQLLRTSLSLFSLAKSPWAYRTGLLGGIESLVIEATKDNGYFDKYGESTVLRAIGDMEREAVERDEPIFRIGVGSEVDFVFMGDRICGAVSKVDKFEGLWFYKVDGVFYAEESVG